VIACQTRANAKIRPAVPRRFLVADLLLGSNPDRDFPAASLPTLVGEDKAGVVATLVDMCYNIGMELDRDINAAINILRLGRSRWALTSAAGVPKKPQGFSPSGASPGNFCYVAKICVRPDFVTLFSF